MHRASCSGEASSSLEAEINQATAITEALDTLADLPDNHELIELIEHYSDSIIDVANADEITTPIIRGLPTDIIPAWNKVRVTTLLQIKNEFRDLEIELAALLDDEVFEEVSVPAYSLGFEAGFEQRYGRQPTMMIKLSDNLSLQGIVLMAIPDSSWHSFEVLTNTGRQLTIIDGWSVLDLLNSLANDPEVDKPDAHFYTRFRRLIGYIGDKHGKHRLEHRLSSGIDMLPVEQEAAAQGALIEVYGAVGFAENENPRQSHREFVIERLIKYPQLDYDVLYRMTAKYYGGGDKVPDQDSFTPGSLAIRATNPLLQRVTYSPSLDRICQASFEVVETGNRVRPEVFGPENAELIIDTLQQVTASSIDKFLPRLH